MLSPRSRFLLSRVCLSRASATALCMSLTLARSRSKLASISAEVRAGCTLGVTSGPRYTACSGDGGSRPVKSSPGVFPDSDGTAVWLRLACTIGISLGQSLWLSL
ncbi:hypothetical protein PR002_g26289 [Phytophthora rubi]|uniref:Secreted protein n=1 Tax=Phytophthora rubi TaxID=129364 RepID=A0A6A3HWL7_9STRA|nr:hypothetical protein PR002_g26289 [Phytophthora rubi]